MSRPPGLARNRSTIAGEGINPLNVYATLGQWQRHPAGSDRQLQHPPRARAVGKQVHHRRHVRIIGLIIVGLRPHLAVTRGIIGM